uniref:Uncharacterized protein n=1 Tax=Anguilla anguilla TaxID=7936 RepID=A0A0E9QHQ1_ANGAN
MKELDTKKLNQEKKQKNYTVQSFKSYLLGMNFHRDIT